MSLCLCLCPSWKLGLRMTSEMIGNVWVVFTIPPDFALSDPERSILAKGLKFVPNSGPIDFFSVKEDFFCRLRLKALFHYNQSSVCNTDVFEAINPKKSSWSPPEGQFSALDLFVRQCCHEIDQLKHLRLKTPTTSARTNFWPWNRCEVGMT